MDRVGKQTNMLKEALIVGGLALICVGVVGLVSMAFIY